MFGMIDEQSERLTEPQLEITQSHVIEAVPCAPWRNRGLPIQLHHPVFGNFLRRAREDTVEINLKPEDLSATHSLFHSSAEIYQNKRARSRSQRVFGKGHWPSN